MTEEMKKNEVTEEQLEGVSGGGLISAKRYKSGDAPRFHVGDNVIMAKNYPFYGMKRYRVRIVWVSAEKNWMNEFTYSVAYEDGDAESGVYESQLLHYEQSNGSWNPYTSLD